MLNCTVDITIEHSLRAFRLIDNVFKMIATDNLQNDDDQIQLQILHEADDQLLLARNFNQIVFEIDL